MNINDHDMVDHEKKQTNKRVELERSKQFPFTDISPGYAFVAIRERCAPVDRGI